MAINLGNLNVSAAVQPNKGVLNLQKGQMLNLTKKEPGLNHVKVGAGWDVAARGQDSIDIDIAALLLNEHDIVTQIPNDVIFFNNKVASGIRLLKDNRTGTGNGDDETIEITLNDIRQDIRKVLLVVTIFEADRKQQTFGMVRNSYIRIMDSDKQDKEICRYELREGSSNSTAVIFAYLEKDSDGDWSFKAVGEGLRGDLNDILSMYM